MRTITIAIVALLAACSSPGGSPPGDGGLGRHTGCGTECVFNRADWYVSCGSRSTSDPCPAACEALCTQESVRGTTSDLVEPECDGTGCGCPEGRELWCFRSAE